MKTLLILTLSFCISARADVLIFKTKINVTRTGEGIKKSFSNTGYVVIDPNNGRMKTLNAFHALGTFYVNENTNFTSYQVFGGTFTNTVLIFRSDTDGSTEFCGKNSLIISGSGTTYTAPKNFAVSGHDMTANVLEEYKGSVALDLKTTQFRNSTGGDFDAAVAYLAALLESLGYVEQ